jgi:hypothetical protein
MSQDIHIVTVPFDGLNNGTSPGFRVPAAYGGITIQSANARITGTANITLVTMTNVGTPLINGTISAAAGGTATYNVPYALTISDGWVAGGEWVGIRENNVGTPTTGHVTIAYTVGK